MNTLINVNNQLSSDLISAFLNHIHVPIIIWDNSMYIKYINRQFELLSGYESSEISAKKIELLFPSVKVSGTIELLRNITHTQNQAVEIEILTKNNKIKTVLWYTSIITDSGSEKNISTILPDNSGKRSKESALIQSETRYRRLFESAKDGILILDAQTGKIVDVNPFLINLLGYSKKEFQEKAIWEIGAFKDFIENKEKFQELQKEEYVRYDDLPLETFKGDIIDVEFVSNVYLADGVKVIQCNIRDNTEKEAIKKEIKFQANLINNVGQSVIATDLSGNIIYWNNAAKEMYGWSAEEAIGENIINITPTLQSNQQAIDIMKKLVAGNSWSGEFYVKRKDGSSFPAFVTDTPILDSNGTLNGVIGISSDITNRKLVEQELIDAKEKAEESDRLKTAFLHNISHEIRTPMNAIVGFSSFLDDPDITPEKRKGYTEIIIQSSDQLLAIIDDIISIASIESGQEKIRESEININSVCKLIYDQFAPTAKEKNIDLTLKTDLDDNEAIIISDSTKLNQILTNLIGNAFKFTIEGFVKFGYSLKDKHLHFFVEDSGIGIQLDMQEKIFNRFRQVETTDKRNYGGSGLGLSISKAYVEMLGGEMKLTSQLGKGSVFSFTIPYRKKVKKTQFDTSVIEPKSIKSAPGKTMLIAEDEDSNYMLLKEILSGSGFNIIRALNGIEAVNICKSEPKIDIVLMDIKMPGMDGYEATELIKEINPDLPIIAQSAYVTEADKTKALSSGCSDFISKPINKKLLLSKISEQIQNIDKPGLH